MNINKTDILALNQEQLYQSLSKLGWEKYRLKQIEEWLWKHGVRQFEEMSNLSKNQRELLDLHFSYLLF